MAVIINPERGGKNKKIGVVLTQVHAEVL